MKLGVSLLLVSVVVASVAGQQGAVDIRTISIKELLASNPELKAELKQKIKSRDNTPAAPSRPATGTTTNQAPAAPAPQADSPPTPTEATTAARGGGKRRGNAGGRGRGNGAGRRRRPVTTSESDKFGSNTPGHRLRVAQDNPSPRQANGRTFPGAQ